MTSRSKLTRQSRWSRAEEYFINKSHAAAQRELETLHQSSNTPLERAAHTSNLQAVRLTAGCDDNIAALEEVAQRCSVAAVGAGVGVGQKNIEVVVSARYNAGLAFMKCGRIRDGVHEAEKGLEAAAGYVGSLDTMQSDKKRSRKSDKGWKEKLMHVKRLIEEIDIEFLGDGQWIEATVDVIELLAAGYVMVGKKSEAGFLLTIVEPFRNVAVLVTSKAKATKEGELKAGESEDVIMETDDEDNESGISADAVEEESVAKARDGGRKRCTLAFIHASGSNWDQALEVLRFDCDNSLSDSTSIPSYWPAVYLSATILFCRGTSADLKEAQSLFDKCTAAFYRPADASAMSSRISSGDDALQAWKRTLVIDHSRFGALWEAGKSLGRYGRHKQRYKLLTCLHEAANPERESHLGGDYNLRQKRSIRLPHQSASYDVTEKAVAVASAYTHAARGNWLDAVEIVNELDSAPSQDQELKTLSRIRAWVFVGADKAEEAVKAAESTFNSASDGTEQAGILLAKAEALAALQQVEEALKTVENAFDVAQLSRAAYVEKESHDDSNKLRFLRGLCYNNRGVLLACLGNVRDADESFTAGERAFEKCARLNRTLSGLRDEITTTAAGFSLASSYNRCLNLWRRRANKNAIAHWLERRGIAENAEGEESDQVLQKARIILDRKHPSESHINHLRGKLEERERAKLDVLFIEKRKAAVAKERAGALLDDLQETW